VHNCRQFLDRALAPEVMFPSPQRPKPNSEATIQCTAEAVLHPDTPTQNLF
jgi:hypothetical protein